MSALYLSLYIKYKKAFYKTNYYNDLLNEHILPN